MTVVLLLMLLICQNGSVQDAVGKSAELDAYLAGVYRPEQPGAVVLVQVGDRVVLHKGYGLADLEWQRPMPINGVFRLASVTKPFTATLVMMLVEQGTLDLEAEIQEYLPEYPRKAQPIRIKHLLQHTSGTPNFTNLATWEQHVREDLDGAQMTAFFQDLPLEFPPGERFAYSNSGYFLLGRILERVSGKSYAALIESAFAEPLQRPSLQLDPGARLVPWRISGYKHGDADLLIHPEAASMTHPFAAGALLAQAEDVAVWFNALLAGRFIPAERLGQMWQPQALNQGQGKHGMGWLLGTVAEQKLVWHSGGIDGFTSDISYVPAHKLLVVTLHNLENPKVTPSQVNRALLKRLLVK